MAVKRLVGYRLLLAAPPLAFLAVFYFYPLAGIFLVSFRPEGTWDLAGLHKLIGGGLFFRTLWFTFWQAAVSTILTLAAALPGAYVFARFSFPGRNLVQSLTTVPFVLPTVVVAAAFRALLGPNGLLNLWLMETLDLAGPPLRLEQTVWFFLLAHVFYNYTLVLRIVGGFWSHLDPRLTEAARMLGASKWRAFRRVTLPLLRPALWAAALLVFIFCFTSFGVILILGGPRFATLEVEIYRQAVHLFNLPLAAALSLLQILFTLGLMWVYTWIGRRASVPFYPEAAARNRRPARGAAEKLLVAANLGFLALLLGAPLAALVVRSFTTETGLSVAFYQALFTQTARSVFFVPPFQAVLNSVGFALAAMGLALVLGLFASSFLASPQSRAASWLDPLFMLPLATSAVTLGFGYIITLNRPPLNLRDSAALVPLAHCLVAFPFVVRCLLPGLRGIPPALREAAAVLGASPLQVWRRIDLPIVGRAVLIAAVFAFSVSLGEFGATAFVARPHTPTMPVAIYRFLGQPGALNFGQAMAMSTLLMLVTGAGFLLLEKIRVGPVGDF
ncbi:MAG: iron ABC transporter permease [Thermodesulfobacteriota bacterium]